MVRRAVLFGSLQMAGPNYLSIKNQAPSTVEQKLDFVGQEPKGLKIKSMHTNLFGGKNLKH